VQLRIPGELHRCGHVPLQTSLVDGSLPALILHPTLHLRAAAEPFHDGRSELVLRRAACNEVLRSLLVQIFQLD